ncbi:acetate--CoA ligase family protein [Nonomuraea endophytica]|uniref:Acyl-CoA synthetase (NDP forming) n=1 Tax=Nonomuraea endophytica TaxID=714136 RepID=A0A7W8A8Z0_9ACTN|nr:acetate--CoA ligase family protein [Nonomuraea endophytica]MBB5081826.1 acyl-CoA synthetase (NDP forming) [Nonomuraea endophytica]
MRVFSDPASVAVVGASADPAKWGYWLARGALRGSHRRKVHLVSRSGAVVDGVRAVPGLRALAEPPELAVLCTPAAALPALVDEALELGVKGFVGITAGLPPAEEAELAERVRRAGARLIGPNCLGIYDASAALELAWGTFSPGALGIVSQSGQLGLELAGLAGEAGIGVSRFVSVGNQADVTAVEVLDDLAGHAATRVVVVYLESFGDGRALVRTLAALRSAGKPVIVLTVGASDAGRAAARSHTGSLTAGTAVVEAACRAAGAILTRTPAQAVDLAQLLLDAPAPVGRRVAVVGDSGGQGALAADLLSAHGLEVPALEAAAPRVAALLPPGAAVRNPIDLAGAGERDLSTYAKLVGVLLDSGEVDSVLLTGYFGSYGADAPSLLARELAVVDTLGTLVRERGRTVVVHSMCRDSAAVRALREHNVPTYATIDQAVGSLGLATELASRPVAVPAAVPAAPRTVAPGYLGARALFEWYGVPYPRAVAVSGEAAEVAGPYVLKAGWLAHKTESGGVAVGLRGPDQVGAALAGMRERLGAGEYVLEEMDTRAGIVELIAGGRRDPSFGPVVMVGAGGTLSELYEDVVVALAPVDEEQALAMLRRLRAYPLLRGWRGAPPVDEVAAARVVVAVSRVIAEQEHVAECEINPLRAGPDGVLAVDALVVIR